MELRRDDDTGLDAVLPREDVRLLEAEDEEDEARLDFGLLSDPCW
jgi:hypothetical protein